jgi:hypothetical protein
LIAVGPKASTISGKRQVFARAAVEPHPLAILTCDDAEAVVLDLVQPKFARRLAGYADATTCGSK